MDLFEELEQMALNAFEEHKDGQGHEASEEDVSKWQRGMITRGEESQTSTGKSSNTKMEAQGYDREAFEHRLEIGGKLPAECARVQRQPKPPRVVEHTVYIVKLEGSLDTPEKIREAAGLKELPEVIQAVGHDGNTTFCGVNGVAKQTITNWIYARRTNFRPTFVCISQAEKALSNHSLYPTLGLDTTLPQNRPVATNKIFYPTQNQYPVWYFFYGTLANSSVLSRQLSLPGDQPPILEPATITGGILRAWAGKYRALVDGPANSLVAGSAYEVSSREHENALRSYETDSYEVVRCTIFLTGSQVQGCTFRFVGTPDVTSPSS